MKKEIINTLEWLINFKSVSENKKETETLLNKIASKMDPNLIIKKHCFNGFSSLVISNTNEDNYDVVFCVHIDVVPCAKYQFQKKENTIYGRGAIDMKGAVSVCITLLNHLNTEKKVALFITSDEEIDGNCAKQLVNLYPNIKLAIIPDGGSNFDLIIEEKGLLQLKLEIETIATHASTPFLGENAVISLCELYNKIIKKYPLPINEDDYRTSITLTKLEGGSAYNQVPSHASMILDIRYTTNDKPTDIIKFIKKLNSNIQITIITQGSIFTTDTNNDNVKSYLKSCYTILGKMPKFKKITSTSDAIYFCDKKIPTIIMNPVGGYPHSEKEFVTVDSLILLYEIYQHFLSKGEIK